LPAHLTWVYVCLLNCLFVGLCLSWLPGTSGINKHLLINVQFNFALFTYLGDWRCAFDSASTSPPTFLICRRHFSSFSSILSHSSSLFPRFFCRFYFVSLAPFLTLCRLLFMRSVITIRANEWHIRLPLKQISISAIERRDYGEEFNL